MNTLLTILLSISICTCPIDSLSIEVESSRYELNQGETVFITEYSLTNNTEEDYYSWVDYNEKDEGRSKDILRFFIRHNGDFSFLDLITDNVSFPEGFPHRLGQSFITLIKPGESFRYIVLGDEPIDEDKSFGNFIVSAPKRFVECNIVVIDDCFIYNGTCIVVKRDYAY